MKHLVRLYQNNFIVALICDGIALMVFALTAIFTITVLTVAFAI